MYNTLIILSNDTEVNIFVIFTERSIVVASVELTEYTHIVEGCMDIQDGMDNWET